MCEEGLVFIDGTTQGDFKGSKGLKSKRQCNDFSHIRLIFWGFGAMHMQMGPQARRCLNVKGPM